MGTRALPDMYALSPWACGPRALDIHIRQSTHAHVTTITCTLHININAIMRSLTSATLYNSLALVSI